MKAKDGMLYVDGRPLGSIREFALVPPDQGTTWVRLGTEVLEVTLELELVETRLGFWDLMEELMQGQRPLRRPVPKWRMMQADSPRGPWRPWGPWRPGVPSRVLQLIPPLPAHLRVHQIPDANPCRLEWEA